MSRGRGTRLPLFRRPGVVAVLDTDAVFRQTACSTLGRHWAVQGFATGDEFRRQLLSEAPFVEADAWSQQDLVHQWRARRGKLAAGVVRYLARNTERYGLSTVSVVGLHLERALGTEVLKQLRQEGCTVPAILLTGTTGDRVAVAAFNAGLIQRYEVTQGLDFHERLEAVVAEVQDESNARLDQIWRSTLTAAQDEVLRGREISQTLGPYLRERMFEYVVIGDPFGVLGLSAAGELSWLALGLAGVTKSLHDLSADLDLAKPMSPVGVPVSFGHDGLFGQFFVSREQVRAGHPLSYDDWRARQRVTEHA